MRIVCSVNVAVDYYWNAATIDNVKESIFTVTIFVERVKFKKITEFVKSVVSRLITLLLGTKVTCVADQAKDCVECAIFNVITENVGKILITCLLKIDACATLIELYVKLYLNIMVKNVTVVVKRK